jgi:SAM-dependent methyltransferase
VKEAFGSWEDAVIWLRGQPSQEQLIKECYYDDPLLAAARRYHDSSEWLAVQQLLKTAPRGNALDVGAGRGIASYALACDGWQVTALEPDASNLVGTGAIRRLAAEAQLDMAVVQEECERLPFADGEFQLVFIRQALHHARDLGQFCCEVARVLKPGGIFLAVREHVISRSEDLGVFLDSHPLHGLYGGEHAYLLRDYLSALTAAGLTMSAVLAPFASDINLFPDNRELLQQRIGRKLGVRLPDFLFQGIVVPLLNFRDNTPGRLYSFMGCKK